MTLLAIGINIHLERNCLIHKAGLGVSTPEVEGNGNTKGHEENQSHGNIEPKGKE